MGVLPSSYGAAPLDRLQVLQAHDLTELPGVHDLLDYGVYGVYPPVGQHDPASS